MSAYHKFKPLTKSSYLFKNFLKKRKSSNKKHTRLGISKNRFLKKGIIISQNYYINLIGNPEFSSGNPEFSSGNSNINSGLCNPGPGPGNEIDTLHNKLIITDFKKKIINYITNILEL